MRPADITAYNRPGLRAAWKGPSCLLLGNDAACGGPADGGAKGPTGYFFREARHLDRLRLLVQREGPLRCTVAQAGPDALEWSLIYPPVTETGGGGSGSGGASTRHGVLARGLDLRLRYALQPAGFEALLRLTNRWDDHVELDLAWGLGADFADLIEVKGEREQEAPVEATATPGGVHFRYGHPDLPLETHARAVGPGEWAWDGERLGATVPLARQETVEVRLVVRALDG
ncbi:MAG: glycogen debranching N-terminal domain-containing protein, partial [Rhodothermales bacterium]|nr:glycogen debranching N-terminal domain-containing protein [Rhodothermales bacterium]